jgi:broad specificity phosphatase PhoE
MSKKKNRAPKVSTAKSRERKEAKMATSQFVLKNPTKQKPTIQSPMNKPDPTHETLLPSGSVIIFIRHGCDAADHTDIKHIHDPPLCNKERHLTRDIENVVNQCLQVSNGIYPSMMFTSPMQRCVQTTQLLETYCPTTSAPIWTIEASLSRHFKVSEQENPKVSPRTVDKGIPMLETIADFKKRNEKFLRKVAKETHMFKKRKVPIVVWCITHALNMKHVFKSEDHMKPLEMRVVQRDNWIVAPMGDTKRDTKRDPKRVSKGTPK